MKTNLFIIIFSTLVRLAIFFAFNKNEVYLKAYSCKNIKNKNKVKKKGIVNHFASCKQNLI